MLNFKDFHKKRHTNKKNQINHIELGFQQRLSPFTPPIWWRFPPFGRSTPLCTMLQVQEAA